MSAGESMAGPEMLLLAASRGPGCCSVPPSAGPDSSHDAASCRLLLKDRLSERWAGISGLGAGCEVEVVASTGALVGLSGTRPVPRGSPRRLSRACTLAASSEQPLELPWVIPAETEPPSVAGFSSLGATQGGREGCRGA